jgi:hypothetical protein
MNQAAIDRAAGEWYQLGGEVEHLVTNPAVREWRYESLMCTGFTASQAEIIAASAQVDIHWLIDLTRRDARTRLPTESLASTPSKTSPQHSSNGEY